MAVCTFFGHHDCPSWVKPRLQTILIDLIENSGVDTFYVGNQGTFDAIARTVLSELKQIYPHIHYTIVLAYMPQHNSTLGKEYEANTMLPEGIENVPRHFAIIWRNKWMLRQAEYVVAYVVHSFGGAVQFVEMAQKQEKTVIHLGYTGL